MDKFEYDPQKILDSIIEIEKRFPVNEWRINGVQFWPFIRTSLAYTQRFALKPASENKTKSNYIKMLSEYGRTLLILPVHVLRLSRKIKQAKRIFTGAITHRINIEGKLYNKYFDAAVTDFNVHGEVSVVLDRGTSLKKAGYPNNEGWFSLPSLYVLCELFKRLGLIKKKNYVIELKGYDQFYDYLISNFKNIEHLKSGFNEKVIRRKMINFHDRKEFVKGILKDAQVRRAYFLCYYTSLFYPLIAAFNELKIDTVDIQHGGMGKGHWSYDRWSNVPAEGYALLPRYFWSWDDGSAKLINDWAQSGNYHKAINMGTPWINDYVNISKFNPEYKNYILFNMADVNIKEYVVEAIRHFASERKWILRMHPRQMHKREMVEQQIADFGIGEIVSIEDSTKVLLRDSLQFCSAFISASSGSIIEAIQIGLTPILLPSPGSSYYSDYIKSGKIIPLLDNSKADLIPLLQGVIKDGSAGLREINQYQNPFLDFEKQL